MGRNACSQVDPTGNPNLPDGSVLEREVGIYGHVASDIALFVRDWNFDYIKVDGCGLDNYQADQNRFVRNGTYREFPNVIVSERLPMSDLAEVRRLYTSVRDALAVARPRQDWVLSLCNWGTANVRAWGGEVGKTWRTSFDIAPQWTRMLHTFDTTVTRELYSRTGHFNDPDMLFIGHGDFDAEHLDDSSHGTRARALRGLRRWQAARPHRADRLCAARAASLRGDRRNEGGLSSSPDRSAPTWRRWWSPGATPR